MSAEKYRVVVETIITHCKDACPYFGIDGGPGPVMCCNHPQLAKEGIRGYDTCIISHPDCDTGFPKKCPLHRLPEAMVEIRTSHNKHMKYADAHAALRDFEQNMGGVISDSAATLYCTGFNAARLHA